MLLTCWWWRVPGLSCACGWCPTAPGAFVSCCVSPLVCAGVCPPAPPAAPPSAEPDAPSARPGTSLPAAHDLQSNQQGLGQYRDVLHITNIKRVPLFTSVSSKFLHLMREIDSMAWISRIILNFLLSSVWASSSAFLRSS